MKIVFLDVETLGSDLDLSAFEQLGEVVMYPTSTIAEAAQRTVDADIVIANKIPMNETTIGNAERLKLICITATGTNNLDKEYLAQRNILWKNAADYSTESVAQHTFALFFYLMEKLRYYDDFVKDGSYIRSNIFTNLQESFHEIAGSTWGIIGLGNIGRRVASIASAFGANVIYASASGSAPQEGYHQVSLDELYAASDVISIHAPLNQYTEGLINQSSLKKMKPNCILLNLGRGPIVAEADLADALHCGTIAAAGLDVLCEEPIRADNPLFHIKDSRKLIITPHTAWASVEARTKLMEITLSNVKNFLNS